MSEALEQLMRALMGEGDPVKCVEVVASNLPDFIDNEMFVQFPEPILDLILQHPQVKFPEARKTANFFLRLFDRDQQTATMFSDLVPFDQMDAQTLSELAAKCETLSLITEANKFRRVAHLYEIIDKKEAKYQDTQNVLNKTAEQLDKTADYIPKASKLLDDTTKSLALTQFELRQTQDKLIAAEEKILKLKKQKAKGWPKKKKVVEEEEEEENGIEDVD